MSIRWDPLLVRHLAAELDGTLSRARLRALRFDGARRDLALLFRDRTLLWRLHPERGWLRRGDAVEPAPSDVRIRARVRAVTAPPDERLLRIVLLPERGGRPHDLIVELLGNRLNAIVTEGEEAVIRHVLVRREGARPLRVGARWSPPEPTGRSGADGPLSLDAWRSELAAVEPAERGRRLVRRIAWTSPLNAETILGSAGAAGHAHDAPSGTADLEAAFHRWRALVGADGLEPVLLRTERGLQPYPAPLGGLSFERTASLVEAFERCAAEAVEEGEAAIPLAIGPELLERLDDAVRQHERRVARLRAELAGLEDPASLRAIGDLILARFGDIRSGAEEVELSGFDGAPVRVALDPALAPHENADRYYDRAGRSERAATRLPELIAGAERDVSRFEALRTRAVAGEADADEIRAALPARMERKAGGAVALPYRTFRSSGGLEIRVGRGARHNDDLTFRHSAPGDVWLHARHTAGAHVVLRWPGEGAPPARDLAEAATLAALHSKARTSGSVPVDWTFRKYVRKPRGAPPGSVVPDRVSTLFVEPDPALEEALADPA